MEERAPERSNVTHSPIEKARIDINEVVRSVVSEAVRSGVKQQVLRKATGVVHVAWGAESQVQTAQRVESSRELESCESAGNKRNSGKQSSHQQNSGFRMSASNTAKVAPSTNILDDKKATSKSEKSSAMSSRENQSEAEMSKTTPQPSAGLSKLDKVTRFKLDVQKKYPLKYKASLKMETRWYNIFITSFTVFALFGDDLRVAYFSMGADNVFYSLSMVGMLAFAFELFILSYVRFGYYKSFYFWLDVIATVTMISDIGFIWNPFLSAVLGGEGGGNKAEAITALSASRVGTKSSRIVRIVRIVRLVRVVKLYKAAKGDEVEDHVAEENPSLVGKKLSDKTMQRVITVVLSMLVFVQFFDPKMYTSEIVRGTSLLNVAHRNLQCGPAGIPRYSAEFDEWLQVGFKEEVQDMVKAFEHSQLMYLDFFIPENQTEINNDMIIHYARDTKWWNANRGTFESSMTSFNNYKPDIDITLSKAELEDKFRDTEYEVATATDCYDVVTRNSLVPVEGKTCTSVAYYNIKASLQFAAVLNILQTIFVMVVLTAGSMTFNADAERMVIRPIEKMVQSVKDLAENPMGTAAGMDFVNNPEEEADETVLLQRTIGKIGQLLQIGFGEAGSEIIAMNMSNNAGIEPMCDGVKIEAVFGFCDIRNFTDTTECLQEKVMVYVNKVGSIVHEATHLWYGAANKNIGDAFLLVWKVKGSKKATKDNGNMCDNALVAFLKAMIDLKRENGKGGCLYEYKDNHAIRKRFGENKFEIKLGMGLHIGWAIEGTIGSKYKIDASYLSPNVNMAARLEAATKQFRTPLLLSEDFYDALSSKARKRCRQIDRVTVKGSIHPMGLFTCDINTFIPKFGEAQYDENGIRKPYDFEGEEFDAMQAGLPQGFFEKCREAFLLYMNGEWPECKLHLEEILKEKPEDGPTVSLLEVLQHHGNVAPPKWKGFRELTEK